MELYDIGQSKVVDSKAAMDPMTPVAEKEKLGANFGCESPLTLVSSPPRVFCSDSIGEIEISGFDCITRTPNKDIFDPFAPGPDALMLAPRCKKYLGRTQNYTVRRLRFDSSDSDELMEECIEGNGVEDGHDEQMYLELLSDSFFNAIVSMQTEEVLAESLDLDGCSDGFKTPTSISLLNSTAETCPDAPLKSRGKLRSIDQEICRKLEF